MQDMVIDGGTGQSLRLSPVRPMEGGVTGD